MLARLHLRSKAAMASALVGYQDPDFTLCAVDAVSHVQVSPAIAGGLSLDDRHGTIWRGEDSFARGPVRQLGFQLLAVGIPKAVSLDCTR